MASTCALVGVALWAPKALSQLLTWCFAQRLCVVPDGDPFAAIRAGRADVVTDTVVGFTEKG